MHLSLRCGSEAPRRLVERTAPCLERDLAPDATAARRSGQCAREEFAAQLDAADPGLRRAARLRSAGRYHRAVHRSRGARPKVAVLREQGVNSQVEMAAVLDRAGFEAARHPHERHALRQRATWRSSADSSPAADSPTATCSAPARAGPSPSCSMRGRGTMFAAFFARETTFTLGVCNGCQMMAALKDADSRHRALAAVRAQPRRAVRGTLQPGGDPADRRRACWMEWPARVLPMAVAHGEGRAEFASVEQQAALARAQPGRVPVRGWPRPAGGHLSGQSERLPARHCRSDQYRWPGAADHAASGTLLARGAEFLASAGRRRVQRLDAAVPEREALHRLVPWREPPVRLAVDGDVRSSAEEDP